ncbi:radical SAM family heme chaperone HemW [Dissulfurirhabdus thermomarina]|uniref:Heme chaperone HemW n=1 Tax=Dissulfurirhabdus thermomarina TaxID=1765737 RepID=A0A6N9TRD5_DISTH|nr:radical SAM family heme chaperone HemW [Dissulfurirhabdus thermomarina]NDY42673.1 radical SAM family heme chaperone HemW [Dissulfurirhabdus thermomarina]NMX23727.1 radical SAM family heme chaperone HemW [Dissulfurirhabdus thermomarina]
MAGLYVHVPFCATKCPYCDFVSAPASGRVKARYLEALRAEARRMAEAPEVRRLTFSTLYVGGGTPTTLPADALADLVRELLAAFTWGDAPEVTVEANPESTTREGLARLKAAGVNRVSIGLQGMSDRALRVLGRPHDASQGRAAVAAAAGAGLRVGVDLIFGWPGQDPAEWMAALEAVVELGPEHVSAYELSVEAGTPLAAAVQAGRLRLPGQALRSRLTDLAEDILEAHGYRQYEISNFARPGGACRHNLNYWDEGPYLGLGAAAASFLPPARVRNVPDTLAYIDRVLRGEDPREEREELDPEARFREAVVLALRTRDGIDPERFRRRWGLDPAAYYGRRLVRLVEAGLLEADAAGIRLTRRGRRLANQVWMELV